jgi:hypothetical protein
MRDCTGAELAHMAEVLLEFGRATPKEAIDPDKLIKFVQSREPGYRARDTSSSVAQWLPPKSA